MRGWPWITMALAAIALLSPVGREFVYAAWFSGEQLSRNIAQGFLLISGAVVLALATVEMLARWVLRRRRARLKR